MLGHRAIIAIAASLSGLLLAGVTLSGVPADASPSASAGPAGATPVVAVVGDSIESGRGLQSFEAWPAVAAADSGWILQDDAVSGAGFVAVGATGDTFTAQLDEAIASRADIVLIGASDNDLGQSETAVSSAMATAVADLHAALPAAEIVGYNALTGRKVDGELAPLDAALRADVTRAGGRWIDLGEPYRGRTGLVQSDGEHPTALGQETIASAFLTRSAGSL